MKEFTAAINSEGQVTIPFEVLQHLNAKTGNQIIFVIDAEGEVYLHVPRHPDIQSLRGAAGKLKTPLPWQQMRAIAQGEAMHSLDQEP